jgi:aryl-alcohol dehydrogenase-like predicted oxidoreductase
LQHKETALQAIRCYAYGLNGNSCEAAEFDAQSWAQVFLKYVVSHPAVTAAIPGTTRVRHVIDNQGAGRGRLPDAGLRREIERYWDSLT